MLDDSSLQNAYLGSLVADSLAMPGHWYYDRAALRRDYGVLDSYQDPRNPHPDSILWRSQYKPVNEGGEILHDQAQYWGKREIHYHQFLKAGENTLNFKLARELHGQVREAGDYDAEAWLSHYVECMLTAGWHRDTYLEECHRGFFTRYAQGKTPAKCGVRDEHIGGLAQVPALMAALDAVNDEITTDQVRSMIKQHVTLTHRHSNVLRAADCLVRLLMALREGQTLREAIKWGAGDWFSTRKAEKWVSRPDVQVVGQVFSPACYIDQAFPAALYIAWKYHEDFQQGVVANAMVGGDNCHRGAVVGALLGASCDIPDDLRDGLLAAEAIGA